MVALSLFVASIGIFSLGQACPVDKPVNKPVDKPVESSDNVDTRAVEYKTFRGDGSVGDGWPDVSSWKNFDSMYVLSPLLWLKAHI